MAPKNTKNCQGDAGEANVTMKTKKRKIPQEDRPSSSSSTAVESRNKLANDDGANDFIESDCNFLRTFSNDDDSSDNDADSSDNDDDSPENENVSSDNDDDDDDEGEAENYENSDSASDGAEHGSPNLSFEEENSDRESDSDISSGSEHSKNKLLFTASTSERDQGQFESFTKSLLKLLGKEGLSAESIEKNETAVQDMFHRNSVGKGNKESMGGKLPVFGEVVLERMKQSQAKAEKKEKEDDEWRNNQMLRKDQDKGKSQKLPKKSLPVVVDEFVAKLNAEKESEEKILIEDLQEFEDHVLEDGSDGDARESDAADEVPNEVDIPSDDDTSSEEESERVGLKRDLVVIGKPKGKTKEDVRENETQEHTEEIEAYDEYAHDTSDEEDVRNTIGNVPLKWYDDYEHVGYNLDGKMIQRPVSQDEIDTFLQKIYDRKFWRTVKDPQTGHDVVLCEADAELINRLQNSKIPDADFQEYAPWVDWFSSEVMEMPLRKFPEHKRSFIPSKDEAKVVSRMVSAMKKGWIKPREKKSKEPVFYNLWESDNTAEHMRRIHNHIPAPKRNLPNHAESYNPPAEYLFDKREVKAWKKLKNTPSKRKLHFIPQKFTSLRNVPAYERYIQERFNRCMDLYLCPRARKMKLLIKPEDLVPQLPSPKDLQPFPTTQSLIYKGHADMVRTITVEPKGQYLASGSDDMTVKIWEVSTGRCVRTIPAGGIVRSVSWCPNAALSLLAVAADRKLLLINPEVGDKLIVKKTDSLLEEHPENDVLVSNRVKNAVQWEQAVGDEWKKGVRIMINHFKEIKQVTWHGRGDYFATVMTEAQNRSVIIHQISKRRSQIPFNKSKGLIQCVLFHPVRPIFFVATQKNVRVYDLMKQEIVKKLMTNAKWISTMAVHPVGDNLLVATYDRKILWFDLDLSTIPYQTLRMHSAAVRGVAYHKRYPLFASCSDDNSVIISHGMVYNNDFVKNPLIVPLKRLTYHEKENEFSAFDVLFHPSQPWLFSSGADGTVRLYT